MWTALLAAAVASQPIAASPQCPAATPFPGGFGVVRVIRVVDGPDGGSHFATDTLPAESHDYLKTGKLFSQVEFGSAAKVRLVSGPANVTFPFHASIGTEKFLTIEGGSVLTLPDGSERIVTPGTLVEMTDTASKTGHGGRTGPCGYVALQMIDPPQGK